MSRRTSHNEYPWWKITLLVLATTNGVAAAVTATKNNTTAETTLSTITTPPPSVTDTADPSRYKESSGYGMSTLTVDLKENESLEQAGALPGPTMGAPAVYLHLTGPTHFVTTYMDYYVATCGFSYGPRTTVISEATTTTIPWTLTIDPASTVTRGNPLTYEGPFIKTTNITIVGPTTLKTTGYIASCSAASPPMVLETVTADGLLSPTTKSPSPKPTPTPSPEPTNFDPQPVITSATKAPVEESSKTTELPETTKTSVEAPPAEDTTSNTPSPTSAKTTPQPTTTNIDQSTTEPSKSPVQEVSPTKSTSSSETPKETNQEVETPQESDSPQQESPSKIVSPKPQTTQQSPQQEKPQQEEPQQHIEQSTPAQETAKAGSGSQSKTDTPKGATDANPPKPSIFLVGTQIASLSENRLVASNSVVSTLASSEVAAITASTPATTPEALPKILVSGSSVSVKPLSEGAVQVGSQTASLSENILYVSSTPIATLSASEASLVTAIPSASNVAPLPAAIIPLGSSKVKLGTQTASLKGNTLVISDAPVATLPSDVASGLASADASSANLGSIVLGAFGWSSTAAVTTSRGSKESTSSTLASVVSGATETAIATSATSGAETVPASTGAATSTSASSTDIATGAAAMSLQSSGCRTWLVSSMVGVLLWYVM